MIGPTHLHLLSNHLPAFGSIVGALILAYALWSKSMHTKIAAYLVFILSAIGASVAYFTGEGAEETVENLQDVSHDMIEMHEDAALYAISVFIALGVLALIAIFITSKRPNLEKRTAIFMLLVSLFCFTVAARTSFLGGKIRHSEIRGDAGVPATEGNMEEENHDE